MHVCQYFGISGIHGQIKYQKVHIRHPKIFSKAQSYLNRMKDCLFDKN